MQTKSYPGECLLRDCTTFLSDQQQEDDDELLPRSHQKYMCPTELVDASSVLGRVTENF